MRRDARISSLAPESIFPLLQKPIFFGFSRMPNSKADFCLSNESRVVHYLCISFQLVAALCVSVKYSHAHFRPSINVIKCLIFKSVRKEQLFIMEDSQGKPRGNIWNPSPADAADEYNVSLFDNKP